MSARRVIGPIFYDCAVNAVRYVNNILPPPFFAELAEEERLYGVSQQNSASAHAAM
jgi:predicted metalloendopeptidase